MLKLKFQKGNAKLNESIYTFSLPEALKALKGSSGYNKSKRKAKEALQIVGQ